MKYRYIAVPNRQLSYEDKLIDEVTSRLSGFGISQIKADTTLEQSTFYNFVSLLLRISYYPHHNDDQIEILLRQIQQLDASPLLFIEHDISLSSSFRNTLKRYPQLQDKFENPSFNSALHLSKEKIWDGKERGEFEKRQVLKQKMTLPTEELATNQGELYLGSKYGDARLVLDVARRKFIEIDFQNNDHMDPWKYICDQLKRTLDFLNQDCFKSNRNAVFQCLSEKLPSCFMLVNNQIRPTQYLRHCLYNYTANLTSMVMSENLRKSNKSALNWLINIYSFSNIFQRFILEKPYNLDNGFDAEKVFKEMVSRTSLFTSLNSAPGIKADHRNKPLGATLQEFLFQDPKIKVLATVEKSLHSTRLLVHAAIDFYDLKNMDQKEIDTLASTLAEGLQVLRNEMRSEAKLPADENPMFVSSPISESSESDSGDRVPMATLEMVSRLPHSLMQSTPKANSAISKIIQQLHDLEEFKTHILTDLREKDQVIQQVTKERDHAFEERDHLAEELQRQIDYQNQRTRINIKRLRDKGKADATIAEILGLNPKEIEFHNLDMNPS